MTKRKDSPTKDEFVYPMPLKYKAARVEAERFIARLEALEMRYLNDADARYLTISGSKEASAAKRASLDLTRALAEMRKP